MLATISALSDDDPASPSKRTETEATSKAKGKAVSKVKARITDAGGGGKAVRTAKSNLKHVGGGGKAVRTAKAKMKDAGGGDTRKRTSTASGSVELDQVKAIELFSGSGGLSKELTKKGLVSWEVDSIHGMDLTKKDVVAQIQAELRKGRIRYVHAAPPCATFSIARRPRVRSSSTWHIMIHMTMTAQHVQIHSHVHQCLVLLLLFGSGTHGVIVKT